jgi:hypothetical protein
MLKTVIRPVSLFLVFSFVLLDFSVQTAKAQMIDTHTVIAAQEAAVDRQRVAAFLEREDVQQVLVEHGVEAVEAQNRVASLSDAEIARISGQIDQLPAGGDAVGAIVGAALFVFIVLLVTDLLGLTHVFSFVNHPR